MTPCKPAAMDRELRHVEAGIEPAQFVPDGLAETVGVEQFVGADGDRVEPLEQAELFEFADGVGQGVDADAEFADLVGLLENLAVDAAGMQHQRRRQPAYAAAYDDDFHAETARNTPVERGQCHRIAEFPGNPDLATG